MLSGIPEIVPKEAGVLVPPGDPIALEHAIRTIGEMGYEARKRMGEHGRQHVTTHCNIVKEAARLGDLFCGRDDSSQSILSEGSLSD